MGISQNQKEEQLVIMHQQKVFFDTIQKKQDTIRALEQKIEQQDTQVRNLSHDIKNKNDQLANIVQSRTYRVSRKASIIYNRIKKLLGIKRL